MQDRDGNKIQIGDELECLYPNHQGLFVEVTHIRPGHDFECKQTREWRHYPVDHVWTGQTPEGWRLVKKIPFKVGDVVEIITNDHGNFLGWHIEITSISSERFIGKAVFEAFEKEYHGGLLQFTHKCGKLLSTPKKLGEMVVVFKKNKPDDKFKFDLRMAVEGAKFKETYSAGAHDKHVYDVNNLCAPKAAMLLDDDVLSMFWYPGV